METFSALLALCKGRRRGALMFFLSAPEQTVQQTIDKLVIWDAIALIMTSL